MKQYIIVGVDDRSAAVLKALKKKNVHAFCDTVHAGEEIDGVPVTHISVKELPDVVQNYELVLNVNNFSLMKDNVYELEKRNLPYRFLTEVLWERGIEDLKLYPPAYGEFLRTYGRKKFPRPETVDAAQLKELENAERRLFLCLLPTDDVRLLCWTFGRFCEHLWREGAGESDAAVALLPQNVKHEANSVADYLPQKIKQSFGVVNDENFPLWCAYILRHPDKLEVFDTGYAAAMTYRDHSEIENFYWHIKQSADNPPPVTRLNFTMEEQEKGAELAHNMGILRRYACFSLNFPPEFYFPAIEALDALGIQSVRFGGSGGDNWPKSGVNYADSPERSGFMDAYLLSDCLFLVSDGAGVERIAADLFSKPILSVVSPFLLTQRESLRIGVTMLMFLKPVTGGNGLVGLGDMLNMGENLAFRSDLINKFVEYNKIRLAIPTQEEFTASITEMAALVNGTEKYSDADRDLHGTFKSMMWERLSRNGDLNGLYGLPSVSWLRRNPWFLA